MNYTKYKGITNKGRPLAEPRLILLLNEPVSAGTLYEGIYRI